MKPIMGRYREYIYPLLRIAAGLLFCLHGLPKLLGGWGRAAPAEFMTQMWWAGVIEVFGGALIMIGLFTSPVAFLASGEMAVAYFQAHAPQGFWPIQNGGELPVLFSFVFLYFVFAGGGPLAVERLWQKRDTPRD